jgi:hypothetical protein
MQVNLSEFYTLQEEKRFRFIHRARQTFQFYTPCKTNFSDCYKVNVFQIYVRCKSYFQIYAPCKTNFRLIYHARQTFHIYTPGKTNFSDLNTLQDKYDLYTLQGKHFRFIHPASQIVQVSMPCRTNV